MAAAGFKMTVDANLDEETFVDSSDDETTIDTISKDFSFNADVDFEQKAAPSWEFTKLRNSMKRKTQSTSVKDKIAKLQSSKKVRSALDKQDDGDDDNDEAGSGSDSESESSSSDEAEETGDVVADITVTGHAKRASQKPTCVDNDDNMPMNEKLTKSSVRSFTELNLSRPLIRALQDLGFTKPTAIQGASIPVSLTGCDILANAVTGSGKTAAFMLPVLERLIYRPKNVAQTRVLVLCPTRELAAQCHAMTDKLCKYMDVTMCFIVGGLAIKPQEIALRNRPDIVVATPGRMIDHIRNSQSVHLEDIEILILDEADRLLELGFADEVTELIKSCPRGRQTMLFSATLSPAVEQLANISLNDPKRIAVDQFGTMAGNLQQEFIRIKSNKDSEKYREACLLALCKRSFHEKVIVFLQSKWKAHRARIIFGLFGLKAAELHGNLTQVQRLDALESFRDNDVDFLLCTDLAARGLDIPNVHTVINVDLPKQTRTYIHRIGRTARAGRSGKSVTLVGENRRTQLKQIVKQAAQSADTVKSRAVPPAQIQKWSDKIDAMEVDVAAIREQEKLEKELRIANMEANKNQNIMRHHDEIMARPKRTWFQTDDEKDAAKELGRKQNSGETDDLMTTQIVSKLETAAAAPIDKKAKKEKKKDPLAGLNRKKRRRKQAQIEDEKIWAETRKQYAKEGNDAPMSGMAKQRRAKKRVTSAAFQTKSQLDGDDNGAPKKKKRRKHDDGEPEAKPKAPRNYQSSRKKDRMQGSKQPEAAPQKQGPKFNRHKGKHQKTAFKRKR